MSALEEALRTRLLADGTVSGLVGTRVFPLVVPQGQALPAIAYQRISGIREHTHEGASGLARPRLQYACVATSFTTARGVADAVRKSLDGFAGVIGSVTVQNIMIQNQIDNYNLSADDEASSFTTWLDFVVWYVEPTS